jgi:hypothetical protein
MKLMLGVGLACALAAWQVQEWRYGSKIAEARIQGFESGYVQVVENQTVVVGSHVRYVEKVRVEYEVVEKEVERLVERPVYGNQCLDDDGLRVISSAIQAATCVSGADTALSSSCTPSGD